MMTHHTNSGRASEYGYWLSPVLATVILLTGCMSVASRYRRAEFKAAELAAGGDHPAAIRMMADFAAQYPGTDEAKQAGIKQEKFSRDRQKLAKQALEAAITEAEARANEGLFLNAIKVLMDFEKTCTDPELVRQARIAMDPYWKAMETAKPAAEPPP